MFSFYRFNQSKQHTYVKFQPVSFTHISSPTTNLLEMVHIALYIY